MDPKALNYNSNATVDDNSCVYLPNLCDIELLKDEHGNITQVSVLLAYSEMGSGAFWLMFETEVPTYFDVNIENFLEYYFKDECKEIICRPGGQ